MGLGGTQVIVVDSDSVMSYTQNVREQTLQGQGYRWTRCRRVDKRGMNKLLKKTIQKSKRGREASREEANQNEYNKTSRSELHTHGYFEYQNDVG